jgi:citrate lyase subunit beta/citryl-CoA lyase
MPAHGVAESQARMKRLRSLLFVPGMEKALLTGADALILDLEDSVAVASKVNARRSVHDFLLTGAVNASVQCFVRINPLSGAFVDDDIASLVGTKPDGIVLPKAEGGATVAALEAKLVAAGVNAAAILPIATETPAAMFQLGTYAGSSKRLCGLTWGAEDLPAAMGASTSRDERGEYTAPYQLARSLTLFAAHAAGVAAIETVYPAFRDLEGLAAYAKRGRVDGFTGMMAIHPSQVAPINTAFTPSEAEVAAAQAIVDLFNANPGAGVLNLDGKMIDAPHLHAARRILAMSAGK